MADLALVSRLFGRARSRGPLDELTDREREVLRLMAEGRSNRAICDLRPDVPQRQDQETHVGRSFTELGLADSGHTSRRVLAVLAYPT